MDATAVDFGIEILVSWKYERTKAIIYSQGGFFMPLFTYVGISILYAVVRPGTRSRAHSI